MYGFGYVRLSLGYTMRLRVNLPVLLYVFTLHISALKIVLVGQFWSVLSSLV